MSTNANIIKERYKRFAEEYCKDLNQRNAAIRCGYSPGAAGKTADRLLKKKFVQDEIAKIKAEISKACNVTTERVINELAAIAFGAVDGKKIKSQDKIKALELLCKHLGITSENLNINANVSIDNMKQELEQKKQQLLNELEE